jgi:hypothetical protein
MLHSLAEKFFLMLERVAHRFSLLRTSDILIENYVQNHLFQNQKYDNDKRLSRAEYQIYSQFGEDGIIREIFSRIGTTNKVFVEFGVGNGLENNTASLLLEGWSGFWMEGSPRHVSAIKKNLETSIAAGQLRVKQALVTAENIEEHFTSFGIPAEFDLLSIDIDGNDYWVWQAIERYSPRVVVVEYNALFREHLNWVMSYNPSHTWKQTSYFGASLKSFELLGRKKGYSLVGCNFQGINAFFVRSDLVSDQFSAPFTAENHYEPARYFLYRRNGHPRQFGRFDQPQP